MRYLAFLLTFSLLGCSHSTHHAPPSGAGQAIAFVSDDVYKKSGYPFSVAVEADGWVFLSGSIGIVPGTTRLAPGGIEGETRQLMENIRATLAQQGLAMDRVVKCTAMLADMADWPVFNGVYKEFFDGNYPARSAFGTNGLALDARVELECLAYR